MIIKKAPIVSKKYKRAITTISIILDIVIIALLLIIIFSSIISSSNEIVLKNDYSLIVLTALATISLGDVLLIFQKKSSLSFCIIKVLSTLIPFNLKKQYNIELSSFQKKFCEEIFGLESKKSFIYIYGNTFKGKTTTIICLLSDFWDNIDSYDSIKDIKDVTFIDCTNSKDEIIDFFEMRSSVNTRINKFSKNLIILDNVEKLGSFFIYENIELFSSSKSLFILIEDTTEDFPICSKEEINKSLLSRNFNNNVIDIEKIDLFHYIVSLREREKEVFFALYFLTSFRAFASKSDVKKILKIRAIELHKALKSISNSNIFIPFPLNKEYLYCSQKKSLKNIEVSFKGDFTYNFVLKLLLGTNEIEPECRWGCLVKSPIELINSIQEDEKITLFNSALANGNYEIMYDELCQEIEETPLKEPFFFYEKAFLAFYMGKHEESTTIFKKLIASQTEEKKKKEIILHIVESSHGNPSNNNMDNIDALLKTLKLHNDLYKVCAEYWEAHIDTERGVFNIKKFEQVREDILCHKEHFSNDLVRSITHRSFTDELRCYHILGINPPQNLCDKYLRFLDTCKASRKEYFSNLYIKANTKHYIELTNAILGYPINQSVEDIVENANQYYQIALNSTYGDKKSKSATQIKQLDLNMMYNNFDYEKTNKELKMFLLNSQINKVAVHEAFCMTLIIKSLILNPANITNDCGVDYSEETIDEISNYHKSASKIYREYKNEYGHFRLDFLISLFALILENSKERDIVFAKLEQFKNTYQHYPREIRIIDELLKRKENNDLTIMFVLSLIRSYPIILQ